MLQLHLGYQKLYCLLRCRLYLRFVCTWNGLLPLSSQPSRRTCLSSPRAWLVDNWNLRSTGESGIWSSTGSRAPRRKTKLWLAKCVGASRRRSYVSRTLMPQCLLPAIVSRLSATQESSSVSWTSHSVTNGCRVPRTIKNYNKKISISPDLPPVLRPAKDELLQERSKLPLQTKQKSRIKFLPQWPFVQMKVEGRAPKSSSLILRAVTTSMAGVDPLLKLNESS